MAGPRLVTTAVVLLLCLGTHQTHAQAPTVGIMVSGDPPPDFTPGPNEYRAASGPHTFTCTATGGNGTGNLQYAWTSTCSDCAFATSSDQVITRQALLSIDGGTHTCTASRTEGQSGSESTIVTIVGVGIAVIAGSTTGAQPNNGLVIAASGGNFRFVCRTNSTAVGDGELIGPIGGGSFIGDTNNAGELNIVGSPTPSQQGVYTCCMPFEDDGEGEVNIGIYRNGFSTDPSITDPLVFTPGSPSSTLTCTSTGSVATTVTFTRGESTTVGPLRNGSSATVGGVTYQLTQMVTDRAESNYENVLTITQPLADIVGSTFTCSADNTVSESIPDSQSLTIMAIGITSPAQTPAVGDSATFNCTSLLGQANMIEWLLVGGSSVEMTSGEASLELVFDPVSESMNGAVYTCRVTIDGETVDQNVTVTVQVPTVSVMTSTSGSAIAGEQYSIICTVIGADNLQGATFRTEWRRTGGDTVAVVLESSLNHTFSPRLGQSDGGSYTCEARITTNLLVGSPLMQSDMLDVTVAVPDVTVLITTSGSAEVGMSYNLTCTVSGADNLEATFSLEFTGPNSDSGTSTSLQLPLGTLDLNDAGQYTCTATVSSDLLTANLMLTDTVDVNIPIPSFTVDVQHDSGSTIYAGSVLTLFCDILVGSVPISLRSGVTVTTTWLGAMGNMLSTGGVITVNPAVGSGVAYTSTVVFDTVRTNNAGTYTCQATATHSSSFIADVTTPGQVTISPVDPTLILAVLSSTTRLPNMSPHNTFTLTCTATAPTGVIESKTFTWRRTSGSGGSCGSFSEVMNSGMFQIVNSNVNQPVSTSVLTVTETTAAVWRYCCQASLLGVTGNSDEVSVTVTGPAPPQQPTNLMDIATEAMSTTIQWTVPIIAYTPETYVVNYGTSMSSLDVTSDPVQSGSDFEAVNRVFSVELTDLVDSTAYFYQVVATNGEGNTSSFIESFNTTILRPGPPQNFMLIVSTTNSLSFSWNPPALIDEITDPTRYIVRCEPQLEGIDTPALVNQSISQETAAVTNLFPGVTYRCRVTAMNDRGEGDPAELLVMTLETAPDGSPQNFVITPGDSGPSSRELTFSWDLPPPAQRNGIINSYTISCNPDTETLPRVETTVPGEGGLTVGGFRPFTEYTCTVIANNNQGSGPPATAITMTNEDAPDGPPLSPSFIVTEDPERLLFTVQPPQEGLRNGVIVSYDVRCVPSDDFRSLFGVTGTISSAGGEVGDFTLAADYICFFTASTDEGPGPETTAGLDVTTLPDTPMITLMNQSVSEVLVEWTISVPETSGPGAITLFTVYVDSNPGVDITDRMSYVIDNLAPFQLVMVQVSASTSAGEGARSEAVNGTSSEAPPGPVNILWEPLSASSVDVSWSLPMPNGIILGYSVLLERFEDSAVVGSEEVDGNTLSVQFSSVNITREVPYNVTVTARNSAGMGEPAETVNFTVESSSPPAPSGVNVMRSPDGSSMTVSWNPLTIVQAGSFVTFRVTYEPFNSRRKRQSVTTCDESPCVVNGSQTSVLITGLDSGTDYSVGVTTVNGGRVPGTSSPMMTSQGVSSSSFPVGVVGGVVGGIAAVVIIVVIIIVVCYCVRRNKQAKYAPHYGDYGLDTKKASTRPEPLDRTATKSFMQSEEDLATFDPSTAPVATAGTESQSIERLRAIPVPSFTQHVLEMHQDRDKYFELEYQSISNDPLATYDIAKLPFNKAKNRFANIFPYDFCRVKLREVEGAEGSDYVNASYVDGYSHPNAYVAAQGPLPNTVTDFWRMVWEHRLNTIVMLTKSVEAGKRKCEQYWPDNVNENFDPPNSSIQITLTSIQPFADYEIKKFLIKDNAQPDVPPLNVLHYHFLGWPDHGVPKFATSLIGFIRRVRKEHSKEGPPMLVHCSAGVGRTGTYILLDSMLERMKAEDSVNVYEFLRNMRAKRVFMVQTLAQYTFIHDALEELINCGDTSIAASNLRVKINRLHKVLPGKAISGFEDQFHLLDHVSRKPADNDCSDAVQPYNKAKNRYLDRLPYNLSRTRLRPTGVTGAEYINGSFVDGYKQRNTYIATQAPLQETVVDFWRMIWEFKSKAIVMLCSAEENGQETSYPYWVMKQGEPEIFGKLQVTLASEEPTKDFVIRKFEIKEDKVGQSGPPGFTVTQFHVTQWPEHGRPPSSNTILGLIDQLIKVQRGTGNRSITVMCNDGMGRTGTFICIHAQLERVKSEGVVDFFQFIKSSRIHRPSLVSGLEQYIFCHDAIADYLDSFDTYANFKDLGPK